MLSPLDLQPMLDLKPTFDTRLTLNVTLSVISIPLKVL